MKISLILYNAIKENREDIVRALLESGELGRKLLQGEQGEEMSPLHYLIEEPKPNYNLLKLFSTYFDAQFAIKDKQIPLVFAAVKKKWECARILIEAGKDAYQQAINHSVETKSTYEYMFGWTLLMAVSDNHYDIAYLLLTSYVKPQTNLLSDGYTMLHWGVKNNNPQMIRLLIEYNCSSLSSQVNEAKVSDLNLAASLGYWDCVVALLSQRLIPTNYYRMHDILSLHLLEPLRHAVIADQYLVASMLLSMISGMTDNPKHYLRSLDKNNLSIMDLATRKENSRMLQLLLKQEVPEEKTTAETIQSDVTALLSDKRVLHPYKEAGKGNPTALRIVFNDYKRRNETGRTLLFAFLCVNYQTPQPDADYFIHYITAAHTKLQSGFFSKSSDINAVCKLFLYFLKEPNKTHLNNLKEENKITCPITFMFLALRLCNEDKQIPAEEVEQNAKALKRIRGSLLAMLKDDFFLTETNLHKEFERVEIEVASVNLNCLTHNETTEASAPPHVTSTSNVLSKLDFQPSAPPFQYTKEGESEGELGEEDYHQLEGSSGYLLEDLLPTVTLATPAVAATPKKTGTNAFEFPEHYEPGESEEKGSESPAVPKLQLSNF